MAMGAVKVVLICRYGSLPLSDARSLLIRLRLAGKRQGLKVNTLSLLDIWVVLFSGTTK